MKKRSFLWVLFTTTAFAVAVLVLTPAGQAVGDRMRPILVRVINTASEPVPVTGATSISGTANVNVTNAPDVNIANQPTVNAHLLSGSFVGIDPANNTVRLGGSSETPFQARFGAAFGTTAPAPSSITVPADKQLIIQHVSGNCEGSDASSGATLIQFSTNTGGTQAFHHFPFTPLPSPISIEVQHTFAESTRIYADPGTTVDFQVISFRSATGSVSCFAAISGTLVDP